MSRTAYEGMLPSGVSWSLCPSEPVSASRQLGHAGGSCFCPAQGRLYSHSTCLCAAPGERSAVLLLSAAVSKRSLVSSTY